MNVSPSFLTRLRSAVVPHSVSSWAARRSKHATQFIECNSWIEAQSASAGYADLEILNRVESATRSVIACEAAFERDGVLFHEQEFRLPVINALRAAHGRDSFLRVIDFGGALGSAYWQHRSLLTPINTTWAVVEQTHFVERGRALPTSEVTFYADLQTAIDEIEPNVILLSSVLQYLPDPIDTVQGLLSASNADIIVDRTPMHVGPTNIPTVQKVPAHIYPGSYPAWIISQPQLTSHFPPNVSLNWFAGIEPDGQTRQGTPFQWKGFAAQRGSQ